jgi:hypothetical protein
MQVATSLDEIACWKTRRTPLPDDLINSPHFLREGVS